MSQIADQPDSVISPLVGLYRPVAEEMAQVEAILRQEMRSEFAYVDELVRYGCLLGGKRLRPALLLLAAKAAGEVVPAHLTLAAVVEMIHTATLVHDDVLDHAHIRRHLATVNARWDNETSVLLGDFLFTHAFYLASMLGSPYACQVIGRATNLVCEGEMRQKGTCGDFAMDEATYLQILDAKTAALCACSCELGAHFAQASANFVQRLASYGRNLGIAFQIADDLLDVLGEETIAGKSLGTDAAQQKPTLPVIRALQVASPRQRTALLALLTGQRADARDAVRGHLLELDAIQYTKTLAVGYATRAAEQLTAVSASPARDALLRVARFVVDRDT